MEFQVSGLVKVYGAPQQRRRNRVLCSVALRYQRFLKLTSNGQTFLHASQLGPTAGMRMLADSRCLKLKGPLLRAGIRTEPRVC